MIAQELAIRFPERVRGLVLGGRRPAGRGRRGRRCGARRARRRGAPAAGATRERSWLGEWLFSPRVPPRAARARARAAAALRPPPRDAAGRLGALVGVRLPRHDLAARAPAARRRSSCTASGRDAPISNARSSPSASRTLLAVPGSGHAYARRRRPRSSCSQCYPLADRAGLRARGRQARASTRELACSTGAHRGELPGPDADKFEREAMWRLTDDERELRSRSARVVLEQVRPRVREIDESCDYPHDLHETLAREKLMGLALPEPTAGARATCPGAPTSRSWPRSPARCR